MKKKLTICYYKSRKVFNMAKTHAIKDIFSGKNELMQYLGIEKVQDYMLILKDLQLMLAISNFLDIDFCFRQDYEDRFKKDFVEIFQVGEFSFVIEKYEDIIAGTSKKFFRNLMNALTKMNDLACDLETFLKNNEIDKETIEKYDLGEYHDILWQDISDIESSICAYWNTSWKLEGE